MSLIDDYFASNGINFDLMIEDLMKVFSPAWYKPAVLKSVNYRIPARGRDDNDELNPYEYVKIPIEDKIITNLMNSLFVKSDYADLKTYLIAEPTLDDATEDKVALGLHGKYAFMNNSEDETIVTIQYSEVDKNASSIYDEIYRYLRQCYYYALTSDYNSMYNAMNLLSNARNNIMSKNVHTEKSRRSNQVFQIGLYKL